MNVSQLSGKVFSLAEARAALAPSSSGPPVVRATGPVATKPAIPPAAMIAAGVAGVAMLAFVVVRMKKKGRRR